MIKYVIVLLMIFATPLFAQELEISQQDNGKGSYFNEMSYRASFGTMSVSAINRTFYGGYYQFLNINNDFYIDDDRFFYFATYQHNYNSYKDVDLGVGAYLIEKDWYSLSVAWLLRDSVYITSFRNKLKYSDDNFSAKYVNFFYPEINDGKNELDLGMKLRENASVGYKLNFDFGKLTTKLYTKITF